MLPSDIRVVTLGFLTIVCVNTRTELLKSTLTLRKKPVSYETAVSQCTPGHLVDLREPRGISITHQLKSLYDNGVLRSYHRIWTGLVRQSGDIFRWYDNVTQTNLTLDAAAYHDPPYNDKQLNLDCVTVKYSLIFEEVIVKETNCSKGFFSMCQMELGVSCDYISLGRMKIEPDGNYVYQDIPAVSTRSHCESICTSPSTDINGECWMLTYHSDDQLCRLITGQAMPYWNETCDWFVYDSSWEAWRRNCFELTVLSKRDKEMVLGSCAFPSITSDTEDTPLLISTPILEDPATQFTRDLTPTSTVHNVHLRSSVLGIFRVAPASNYLTTSPFTEAIMPSFFSDVPEASFCSTVLVTPSIRLATTNILSDFDVPLISSVNGYLHVEMESFAYPHAFYASPSTRPLWDFMRTADYSSKSITNIYQSTFVPDTTVVYSGQTSVSELSLALPDYPLNVTKTATVRQSTVSTFKLCNKSCFCKRNFSRPRNDSVMNEIMQRLSIDTKKTLAFRKRRTSSPDQRLLAVSMGWGGICVLIFVVGMVLISDVALLKTDMIKALSNIKLMFVPREK